MLDGIPNFSVALDCRKPYNLMYQFRNVFALPTFEFVTLCLVGALRNWLWFVVGSSEVYWPPTSVVWRMHGQSASRCLCRLVFSWRDHGATIVAPRRDIPLKRSMSFVCRRFYSNENIVITGKMPRRNFCYFDGYFCRNIMSSSLYFTIPLDWILP